MSLYHALKAFSQKDRVRFHIPGHKGGRGLAAAWARDAFSLDVTEFDETDDLQHPSGILKEAQENAARAFGAGHTFYLTNGSTLGLQAAVLAVCKEGQALLVDRTCHKSVISALILAGVTPVFLSPVFDRERGLYTGFFKDQVAQALQEHPDVAGMLLVSPTYYGICTPLSEIANLLHHNQKILIVDEAHGAHFCFDSAFPPSALSQGADLVIQSAHKTLPALGQCSLLHLGKDSSIAPKTVSDALYLLQTTSPSYLLMSSMEEAIFTMQETSPLPQLRAIERLKQTIRTRGTLDFADEGTLHRAQDPMRLVIDFRRSRYSGTEAAALLKQHYGIYPEMADFNTVVCVLTIADTAEDIAALQHALTEIDAAAAEPKAQPICPLPMPRMRCTPREAFMAQKETLPLADALGKTAAQIISVCPPGAALTVPGQCIDEETLAFLQTETDASKITVMK